MKTRRKKPARRTAALASAVGNVVDVEWRGQRQTQWCWAACIEMVLSRRTDCPAQCEVAKVGTNSASDCCKCADQSDKCPCNSPCPSSSLPFILIAYRIRTNEIFSSFDFLKAEVDADRPVIGLLARDGVETHYIVFAGYSTPDESVLVLNPREETAAAWCSYADVCSGLACSEGALEYIFPLRAEV